jgi:hypothetical protein
MEGVAMSNESERARASGEHRMTVTAPRLVPLLAREAPVARPQLRPTVYLPSAAVRASAA